MSTETPNEASIFHTARQIESDEQRNAYLDTACQGDPALRERVQKRLSIQASELEESAVGASATIINPAASDELGTSLDPVPATELSPEESAVIGDGGHSVLTVLGKALENVPHVVLRESADEGADPDSETRSPQMPNRPSDSRYQLHGEIARGGMGAILRGRDTDLGRELAIKVLLDQHKDRPEVIERFIEEAQIGGQLQHPGIAPVYELGRFADRRPFFSMKLVRGETLSKLLKERKDPAEDRSRFVVVFEQVCQTMAYAHSRGVIHRDLKPANIMVGAFGEVQVMDWGLAKVLPAGGVTDEKPARDEQQEQSLVQTLRSGGGDLSGLVGSAGSQTQMGSVMGTPAYMPPEQARGAIDNLDERADVFGLGAILCEILTGKPPYVGDDGLEVYRLASAGKLEECLERLDACGADAELIALTKQCLEPEPAERPRNAGALAERVTGYLQSVETKLRRAEVERAEEAARVVELHRRRKLLYAIAAILMVGFVTAGFAANHFRNLEQAQSKLTQEKSDLATKNKKLADEKEAARALEANLRTDALAAKEHEEKLKDEALAAEGRATASKELAEQKEREARRQYYASDSSNVSFAARSADQYARLDGYLARWESETPDSRDWEYYFLETQNKLPAVDLINNTGRFGNTSGVAWSPDGRKVAAASYYPGLEVFDALLGEKLWQIMQRGFDSSNVVDWSPDGAVIAVANGAGVVNIVDAASGTLRRRLVVHNAGLTQIRWSRDGTLLATCAGKEIKLWDTKTWNLRTRFSKHSAKLLDFTWDADSRRLATCAADGEVKIYRVNDGEVLQQWRHDGDVAAWACSRDMHQMAFVSHARSSITIWDVDARRVTTTLQDDRVAEITRVAWRPDGMRLAAIGGETRFLWDTPTGEQLDRTATPHLTALAWSPDGKMLAAGGDQNVMQIWNAYQTSRPRFMEGVEQYAWGPSGECFLTSRGRTITVWDAYHWKPIQHLEDHPGAVTALCLSPDEKFIASADDQRNLFVWDRTTGRPLQKTTPKGGKILRNLSYSPDQKWLSGMGHDRATRTKRAENAADVATLNVWEVNGGELRTIAELPLSFNLVQSWSPDSRHLLAFDNDRARGAPYHGSLGFWVPDRKEWQPTRAVVWNFIAAGDWSPDGTQVVSVHLQHSLHFFRFPQGGEPRTIVSAHGKPIRSLDWSPTGRRVVSVGEENRARIWDVDTLQQVHEIENVLDAHWDPFGVRLAVQTPQGLEIHDATIGGARGRWTQLLPYLARQQQLERITPEDLRTTVAIHAAQQDWNAVRDDLAQLVKLDPDGPQSQYLAAETLVKFAQTRSAEKAQEAQRSLRQASELCLRLWQSDPKDPFRRTLLANTMSLLDPDEYAAFRPEVARTIDSLGLDSETQTRTSHGLLACEIQALKSRRRQYKALRLAEEQLRGEPVDGELGSLLAEGLISEITLKWTPLDPVEMTAESQATLTLKEDGSILAGPARTPQVNPVRNFGPFRIIGTATGDTYTVRARSPLRRIGRVQIETLPDPSLPGQGQGWGSDGNFCLTQVRAELKRADGTTIPLDFKAVAGDYARAVDTDTSFMDGPWSVVDGNRMTRWDVYPRSKTPHWLALELREAVDVDPNDELLVRLESGHPRWPEFRLGRFRLSVGEDTGQVTKYLLATAVRENQLAGVESLAAALIATGDPKRADTVVESSKPEDKSAALFLMQVLARKQLGNAEAVREAGVKLVEALKTDAPPPLLQGVCTDALLQTGLMNQRELLSFLMTHAPYYELFRLTKQIKLFPADVNAYQSRALQHASFGHWRDSADDYLRAIEIVPQHRQFWAPALPTLVLVGDTEGYRKLCREMLDRFGATDQGDVADFVCKSSLLVPGVVPLSDLPIRVLRDAAVDPQTPENVLPWYYACNALVSYREGKPADAIEWSKKNDRKHPRPAALALAVRAMSEEKLGQHEQALKSLSQVQRLTPRVIQGLGTHEYRGRLPAPAGYVTSDFLVLEVLRREAQALITDKPAE